MEFKRAAAVDVLETVFECIYMGVYGHIHLYHVFAPKKSVTLRFNDLCKTFLY